jgi:small conductance mechanosensitive channel
MLTDQPLEVLVRTLNNSSVDFVVRLWLNTDDYWPAFFYMQEHVKKAFDREGVSIPFPQMDLHMKDK